MDHFVPRDDGWSLGLQCWLGFFDYPSQLTLPAPDRGIFQQLKVLSNNSNSSESNEKKANQDSVEYKDIKRMFGKVIKKPPQTN